MKKVLLILALLLFPQFTLAQETVHDVELWFFNQNSCPYCAQAKLFLRDLKTEFPNLLVRDYEVEDDSGNAAVFSLMIEAYGIEDVGVPAFFIGDGFIDGYNESIGNSIRQTVEECSSVGCQSPGRFLQDYTPTDAVEDADIAWPWVIGGGFFVIIIIAMIVPRNKNKVIQ